jgi:hypothetical protein
METSPSWRRLSDWKHQIYLVDRADLSTAFLREHGLADPVEALRARFPAVAEALETTRFVRFEEELEGALATAGIGTCEVGYHRGVDVLSYVDHPAGGRKAGGRGDHQLDAAELAAELDEETYPIEDMVDALLRIHSGGTLTERAVLLAAVVPVLGPVDAVVEDESALRDCDPSTLPEVSKAFIQRVKRFLSKRKPKPPTGVWPDLTIAQRRGGQKQGAAMCALGLVGSAVGALYAPMLIAISVPIAVLGAIVVILHEAALRRSARGR